jgi:hypothetical protein
MSTVEWGALLLISIPSFEQKSYKEQITSQISRMSKFLALFLF